MNQELQTEINNRQELTTASPAIIMQTLNNEPAQVETWVTDTDERLIPKGDMLALLSLSSQVKLYDWMKAEATDAAKGFTLFYNSHEHFKCSDPVFIGTIQLLENPLGLITETERDAVLRFGQRKLTRAEELVGHKLIVEDFK